MNNLLDFTNAADKGAIAQTNAQRVDVSVAFGLFPSLDLTGSPTTLAGAPTAGTFITGQFWVDVSLTLWVCTAGGTPGTWVTYTAFLFASLGAGTNVRFVPGFGLQFYNFDTALWHTKLCVGNPPQDAWDAGHA